MPIDRLLTQDEVDVLRRLVSRGECDALETADEIAEAVRRKPPYWARRRLIALRNRGLAAPIGVAANNSRTWGNTVAGAKALAAIDADAASSIANDA